MTVKLSQFALPLTPQTALATVDSKSIKRSFETDIGKGGDFLGTIGTCILGVMHALDTPSAKAVAATRNLVWFAQYK